MLMMLLLGVVFASQLSENRVCCVFRLCCVHLVVWIGEYCDLPGMFMEVLRR